MNYQMKPPLGSLPNYGHRLCPESGLWLMNEGSGNTVQDLSGNGNTGTLQADTHFVPGKFGSALDFDGTGDYVTIALHEPPYKSVVVWAYLVNDTAEQQIFSWTTGGGVVCRAGIGIDPVHGLGGVIYTGFNANYEGRITAFVSGWHQIALTWDGLDNDTIAVYLDGVPLPSVQQLLGLSGTNGTAIGSDPAGGDPFTGIVDHAYAYNRILSASEITLLYREPFCMVRTRRRRVIFDEIAGVPPTSSPYYYREIASRRIA